MSEPMEILSPVIGTVAYFSVADGSEVEDHQMIGAVESMKTFFEFRAPCAGIVTLQVKLGETIAQDSVIALIKPKS